MEHTSEREPVGDPLDPIAIDVRLTIPPNPNMSAIADKLVDLYSALDDLHHAQGGSGLTVEGGDAFVAQEVEVKK